MNQPMMIPGSICSQCGFFHPPIKEGEKCPMAKETNKEGKEISLDKFMLQMTNIIKSKLSKMKTDPNKVLNDLTIQITKFLEDYKE